MSKYRSLPRGAVVVCALVLGAYGILAQAQGPQPLPLPPPIAAPADTPYPGTIQLRVDATDLQRRIFNIHETIPVRGGQPIVLLYPQWWPGHHSPVGRPDLLAGLILRANGRRLQWMRDSVDVFAFHVNVPAGVTVLEADYQYTSPVESTQGRVVMTPSIVNLQWTPTTLYPAGHFARQVTVEASVRLPEGWQFATALETQSTAAGITTFKPVSLETLMDSPIFAGRYFKRLDLDPGGRAPIHLDIVADRADLLDVKPEQLEAHRALVQQAYTLFGSHHFAHYDLMLALSDRLSGIGLEHHQSSENATIPTFFTEWDKYPDSRNLLPHELTHSWNGKFRRPADLWTPNYNVPMRDSLLWVYEGQTQYWGFVLQARAGLMTKQQALDAWAATAATFDVRAGREWKTLQDTTNDPITAMRRTLPWQTWQRSEDYYREGQLMWLDADTLIREKSNDQRSLDDFARAFFGINDGSFVPVTYTFEDVVAALNKVQPHDWAAFLRARLDGHGPGAPLDGLARGGYTLVYTDTPTDYFRSGEIRRSLIDLTYSLGFVIDKDAKLTEVLWDGPAYKAGLTVSTQIVSVDGTAYTADRLKDAIKNAKSGSAHIEMFVKNGDDVRAVRFDYHGGLRYPRLERDAAKPARLDQIFTAKR